jgi:hypothetical protein
MASRIVYLNTLRCWIFALTISGSIQKIED